MTAPASPSPTPRRTWLPMSAWSLLLLSLVWSGAAFAAEPAPPDPATVKALVGQLGDGDWAGREEAQRELRAMGPAVRELLPDPAKAADPEVASRLRLLRSEVFADLFPKEVRDEFPLWAQAFEEGDGELKAWGLADALAKRECWPALRELVRWGVGGEAWYPAAERYVGRDPRWNAAQFARYFRQWLKGHPDPDEKEFSGWNRTLSDLIAKRDRQLGSDLAAELLGSRNDRLVVKGCLLAWETGDRRLAGRLHKIAAQWRDPVTDAALVALTQLRKPAPLPGVSDGDLAKLVAEMLRRRPWKWWEFRARGLASVLPGKVRAGLWPLYLDTFREGGDGNGWSLIVYEPSCDADPDPEWNTPEDIAALRKHLKDPCPAVRGLAAYLLARWDDEASRPRLAEMLKPPEPPEVLRLVANGISWHKTPYFIPFLRPLLKREESEVLGAAATALGVCGDEASIPRCIELLETGGYRAAEGAAIALKQFPDKLRGDPRVRKALKERLQGAGTRWDEDDHQQCAWALAALGTKEDLPAFKEYKDKQTNSNPYDEAVRRLEPAPEAAANPAGRSEDFQLNVDWARKGDRASLQWLREYVAREDEEPIASRATACLVALHFKFREEAVSVARAMLRADEPWIADLPAFTAGRLRAAELAPDLAAALRRSDLAAGARVWALGELGDRRAVAALVERGLDLAWVASLPDESRAFGEAPHYWGWHYTRTRLLSDLTCEALAKITGEKIEAPTPEERAARWRQWYERHKAEFPDMPQPKLQE